MVTFAYQIINDASGELCAEGETVHVYCDRSGRPRTLPEKYRVYFPDTPRRAAAAAPEASAEAEAAPKP
jgi:acyl-CoA thioesterase FadM